MGCAAIRTGMDGFAQKEIRLQKEAVRVQLGRDIAISHAMLWKVLRAKEVKGKSHGHALEMTPEIMKELPRALADPIMILRNRKGDDPNAPILPDEIVAVVDLQDKNGSTAIVPIVLKERNGKYMLKTFFGKDDPTWFQKRMMLGDVLYAHKKRALDWVKAIQRHKALGRFTLQDSFFNSISTDTDLVKARVDNEEFYQSAWHGSPYDFREFLLEMIGAGEMAAEKEAVRKQYEGTAQWMKAPNGEATNLTEDQWLTVRTPAFKAWFGDWEKASAAHEIHALIPVEVALSGKSLDKKTAEEVFSSFGEVENVRYGTYATFPKSMVGKIINHKGLDVSQIIADIPHLFSSSVLTFVEPEYKREGHKEHPNILAYHHYVNKFKANGKTYYIRFSLREEKTKDQQKWNGKRILHSTGISDIEIYEDNKKDVSSQRIWVSDPGEESKTSFINYRLADFFDSVKDCSKIVDENGEPLPSAISEGETLAQPAEEKRGERAISPPRTAVCTV